MILTDEETEELLGIDFKTAYSGHVAEYQEVAKTQLKKVVEWGDEDCPHHQLTSAKKRDCCICTMGIWQTLLEETK